MRRDFTWEEFNWSYGPWFRLRGLGKDGISTNLKSGGRNAEAVVQPDMDREGWYWSVKFASYRPRLKKADQEDPKKKNMLRPTLREYRVGGRASSSEEAKEKAVEAFLEGRPVK